MTPEELEAYVDGLAAEFSGRILALMQAVLVLQSQPGYDHERFRSTLAALDVYGDEARERDGRPFQMTPEQKQSFDDTLQFFLARPPVLPEPWIARPPKPESGA